MAFTVKSVEQPEESAQTFYAYFCDGSEGKPRMDMLALQSYISIEEARGKASAYAIANGFSNGFILLTAREIAVGAS